MPAQRTRDTPSRSLEVTTDTLQPPTLAIISPTPRAFTFPINKNETTPFSSPSSSPFEPDLRTLCTPPTLLRTLSPVSPSSSSIASSTFFSSSSSVTTVSTNPTSPASTHKRRKSSICSDVERRPKKGDEDYIKRPENAFILFRRKCCEDRQLAQEEAAAISPVDGPTKKQRQADLSKTISQQWKALSPEERLYWEELAKEKKKEHEAMYPNYVYRPQRTKDRKGKAAKGKRGEYEHETDTESNISFMLPLSPPTATKHGRSASAPTPPLGRQMIQIPSLYMPSCPTSPSLLPMISRRSSHPDHSLESSTLQFDYAPPNDNNLMPHAAFTQQCNMHFASSMNSEGFYQGMYDLSAQTPTAEKNNLPILHPLTMPDGSSLLRPSQQIASPASSVTSGSSGPPSPHSGPFTPHEALPAAAFSFHEASHDLQNTSCSPDSQSNNAHLDMHHAYPDYGWDSTATWGGSGDMLLNDDFDLNSIPAIELGLPKFGDDMSQLVASLPSTSYHVDYQDPFNHAHHYGDNTQNQEPYEQLFDLSDMIAHGF
ncbi:hypothetical protein SERLA73DRAFT_84266 [Serpula lacrymans var. lacrymans S7.3]|uniref:HMG box domain-containing protein n=2 Tax=Serpula lacrymans var. lacrymans TaxID=341189 RepID=F8PIW5_SERL3|nr:uncharacterized protein SERLADRAFT_458400 [Serpula lacrymans var. lacrymans S7.9]EGO04065.1 hypothetical protein SERLA73DRAFT_84266 [Serpula lacrymans var. lacrymans S7.3]EGO29982.1 hypothetical protein SERLADRAFT_458400 [Serpula lacrymans var. lacrymans S7.9]